MCLPDNEPDTTARKPRCSAFGWLQRLADLLRPDELDELDDRQRRDIGLPRRQEKIDAATLLDMSQPGGRRW